MGLDAMILVFRMLSCKTVFFTLLFHSHQRLFSPSSLSAIKVVSSAYLRLLIFLLAIFFFFFSLLAILISACASCSLAFLMMHSEYNLNKQRQYTALMYSFSYLEPVCCSMSASNCCFWTCIQVSQETGKVVWCSYHFKNFPEFVVIHLVKDLNIVNEPEIDGFCFFFSGILLLFLWSNRYWQFALCLF